MNKHAKDTSKLTKNQSLVLDALSGARQPAWRLCASGQVA